MVKNTAQKWTVGEKVNVGFVRGLTVMGIVPTPGDYRPDQYQLRSDKGVDYLFTPHFGLERDDRNDCRHDESISTANGHAAYCRHCGETLG